MKRRTKKTKKKFAEYSIELTSLQTIFNFYKALNVEQIKREHVQKKKNRHRNFWPGIALGSKDMKSQVKCQKKYKV